jgi:hypothetical protein
MSDIQVTYGAAPAAAIETPSESLIKDANRTVIVTDARGRKLGVKRMGNGLVRFRLARILGQDAANSQIMVQAMLYSSVVSVNGDPVPFPKTELQLEALIDRLDMDGLNAVETAQWEEFGINLRGESAADEAKN